MATQTKKLSLTVGLEFQCTNGMSIVFNNLNPAIHNFSHFYYPDTKRMTSIVLSEEQQQDPPSIAVYADNVSGSKKQKLEKAANELFRTYAQSFGYKEFDIDMMNVSPGKSDDIVSCEVDEKTIENLINNEAEFVITFRHPTDYDSVWHAISQKLADGARYIETYLKKMWFDEEYQKYRFSKDFFGHHTCISIPVSDSRTYFLFRKTIAKQFTPTKSGFANFMGNLRFNCQCTLGILVTDVLGVIQALTNYCLQLDPTVFLEDERVHLDFVKRLLQDVSKIDHQDIVLKTLVFIIVYTLYTKKNRKASPFIFRHFLSQIIHKIEEHFPSTDHLFGMEIAQALFKKYQPDQAIQTQLFHKFEIQVYDRREQRKAIQNLQGITLFHPIETQTLSDLRVLVEFRYLFRILSHYFETPSKFQDSQTLSEIQRVQLLPQDPKRKTRQR